ncbi:MAG: leucine-rich repeat domain-containing protein [Prevotella sp.]|nr:leucine-rich repeat domain-containing protein [Prevotella sp.]
MAFYKLTGLTSVTIPNSVTSIGYFAFNKCFGLNKVIVKDIAAWCKINFGSNDANPLANAHHLYSDENTEITNLVIPNSVASIGGRAFSGCSGLTSVTIPNSVTSIGGGAFYHCRGFTDISIPNSVTTIGGGAFYDCTSLISINIPNSVTSIGNMVFMPFSANVRCRV